MIKNLTKHGNSLALIIDRPILELLDIGAETPVSISTDGISLFISPVRAIDPHKEKLAEIRNKVNKKYASTFANLAK